MAQVQDSSLSTSQIVKKLLDAVDQCQLEENRPLVRALRSLEKRTAKLSPKIAIVGETAAGKLDLLQALLGENPFTAHLPSLIADRIYLTYGVESGSAITFADNLTVRLPLDGLSLFLQEKAVGYTVNTIVLSYPNPVLQQGLVLLNTPLLTEHSEAAITSAIQEADATVFVLSNSNKPQNITSRLIAEQQRATQGSFFVLTTRGSSGISEDQATEQDWSNILTSEFQIAKSRILELNNSPNPSGSTNPPLCDAAALSRFKDQLNASARAHAQYVMTRELVGLTEETMRCAERVARSKGSMLQRARLRRSAHAIRQLHLQAEDQLRVSEVKSLELNRGAKTVANWVTVDPELQPAQESKTEAAPAAIASLGSEDLQANPAIVTAAPNEVKSSKVANGNGSTFTPQAAAIFSRHSSTGWAHSMPSPQSTSPAWQVDSASTAAVQTQAALSLISPKRLHSEAVSSSSRPFGMSPAFSTTGVALEEDPESQQQTTYDSNPPLSRDREGSSEPTNSPSEAGKSPSTMDGYQNPGQDRLKPRRFSAEPDLAVSDPSPSDSPAALAMPTQAGQRDSRSPSTVKFDREVLFASQSDHRRSRPVWPVAAALIAACTLAVAMATTHSSWLRGTSRTAAELRSAAHDGDAEKALISSTVSPRSADRAATLSRPINSSVNRHALASLNTPGKKSSDLITLDGTAPSSDSAQGRGSAIPDTMQVGVTPVAPGNATLSNPFSHRGDRSATPEPSLQSAIDRWVSTFRRGDMKAQVACYAPFVDDYFNWHNVRHDQILADKQRAWNKTASFQKYDVTPMSVTDQGNGQTTVLLQKDWDSTTTRGSAFSGSEIEKLVFVKIDDDWKIVGEQEVKVLRLHRQ